MNLDHLDFDIVSNFVLRISYFCIELYICREGSTNKLIFIENEPNLPKGQNERNVIYNKEL